MGSTNTTINLGEELIELNNTVDAQRFLIVQLKLKAAMYKAYFFEESDLAKRLENQIEENHRFQKIFLQLMLRYQIRLPQYPQLIY